MDEFGDFYQASRDAVYRAVLALVGDPTLAEAAVRQAYQAAQRAWRDGQPGTMSESWVLRSALSGRGPQRPDKPPAAEPDHSPSTVDEHREVRAAVRRLPRRLRGVICLNLLAGLSDDETGALVGLAPAAVAEQRVAALAMLRQAIAPGAEAHEPVQESTGPVDVSYDLDASYELGVPLASRIYARAPRPVVVVVTDDEVAQRFVDAYADECLTTPYTELDAEPDEPAPDEPAPGEPEVPRWRLRWRFQTRRDWMMPFVGVPVLAVIVTFVLLGVLGGFGRLLGMTPAVTGSASPGPAATWNEAAFASDCAAKWSAAAPRQTDLRPEDRATLPGLRFAFRDGPSGVRLYATDTVLFTCTRDDSGQARGVISGRPAAGESFLPDAAGSLDYLAVLDLSGGPEYYLGWLPEGARRVIARTPQGQEITGVINGDLFAVWAPHGGLAGAAVHAFAGTREVASGPPSFLRGGFHEGAFGQACALRMLDLLQSAEKLPPAEREVPPVRFRWREGDWVLWFYGTDRTLLQCALLPNGAIEVTGSWFTDPGQRWSALAPLDHRSTTGRLGWAFGRALDGAEQIEVNLTDGRVVLAQIKDGFFAAAWFNGADTTIAPATVMAYTADQVYTRDAAGGLTSRAR